MNFKVTFYCSNCPNHKSKVGSVDNILQKGDVAIHPSHGLYPIKKGKGRAEFTHIKYNGTEYRVADKCDIVGVVDIYQVGGDHSKCQNANHLSLNKQNGSKLQVICKKIETYQDQCH